MNEEQRRVRLIVEAMHTPLVLNPGGWDEDLPEYILGRVVTERLAMIDGGGWDEATDAEAAAHLFTASLSFPIGADWAQIYEHEVSLLMPQIVDVLPQAGQPLTDSQERELKELKNKIRQRQIKEWKIKAKEESNLNRRLVMEEVEKTGKVLVGVMRGDYDPLTQSLNGTIETVLPAVPGIIAAAEEKWKTDPKFPKYVAPEPPPKTAPKVVGAGGKKTEDLPLLAGKPAEKPAAKTTEEELPLMAGGAKSPVTPEEAPSAVTATMQAAAGGAPAAEAGAAITTALKEEKAGADVVKAGLPEVEQTAPPAVVPPAPVSTEKPDFEYYLKDGRGPFANVQLAMDAMGIDKATRPTHNRWDRLSTALKEAIPRRIKVPEPAKP